MSYRIRYNQPTRAAREAAMIDDCADWLGQDRLNEAIKAVADDLTGRRLTRRYYQSARLALSIGGIQGAPVTAVIRRGLRMARDRQPISARRKA
jgi:hypothetical protein